PLNPAGMPVGVVTCKEGDPACDFGTSGDRICTFRFSLCLNVADPRFPCISPNLVETVHLVHPQEENPKSVLDIQTRDSFEQALMGMGAVIRGRCANRGAHYGQLCTADADCGANGHCKGRYMAFLTPLNRTDACSPFFYVKVPLKLTRTGVQTGKDLLRIRAIP